MATHLRSENSENIERKSFTRFALRIAGCGVNNREISSSIAHGMTLMTRFRRRFLPLLLTISSWVTPGSNCIAEDEPKLPSAFHSESAHHNPPDLSVVTDNQWQSIDQSVDRGLRYLASQQQSNGSIPSMDIAMPAVTALYAMAAISAGHEPGEGKYGDSIDRAIDYVLNCQLENGLFSIEQVSFSSSNTSKAGQLALYNHGICGTLLGEVYGMTDQPRAAKIKVAIEKALQYLHVIHQRPLANALDEGGFRYIRQPSSSEPYSDLSVTSWQIMFMRSAHNAGFNVPRSFVDDTIAYVRRCYVPQTGEFRYTLHRSLHTTRGMTGAGVLCLFLTGNYDDEIERASGDRLLQMPFTKFNTAKSHDRYFYAAYYCSQAGYQLGGDYWAQIYVPMAMTLVANQQRDGSWVRDHHNGEYSQTYSSAMAILALTPPYQLLPIYQR